MKKSPVISNAVISESGTALLSPCGRYRYRLTRVWDESLPRVLWIMLNPSTADATQYDPTIRRCMGFAKAWSQADGQGYGGIEVVNLFPLRATQPETLYVSPEVLGPEASSAANDEHLVGAATDPKNGIVICAWGCHGRYQKRSAAVIDLLAPHVDLHYLRSATGAGGNVQLTASKEPKHPLYLHKSCAPILMFAKGATSG